jgi:hypothetical protein
MRGLRWLLVLIFCMLNLFLIYLIAYSPYHTFLEQSQYSHVNYKTRELVSTGLTYTHMLILLASVVWAFVRIWRIKKVSLLPIFSASLTILFLLWFERQNYYPDGIQEFSKDGYRYRIETWYLDGENKYMKWRSSEPDRGKSYKEIKWNLDSAGLHH